MTYALTKQPWEEKIYNLPFLVSEGGSLAAVDSITVTARERVVEVDPLVTSDAIVAGDILQFTVAGGTDGEEYLIRARVVDNNGDSLEEDVEIRVQDYSWSVPEGLSGHLYVTPAELVTKYSYDDVLLLTDTHKIGRIDVDRVGQVLLAATATADSYAAKRYVTPLSPVPEVIKAAVLKMAFFELHTAHVPEAVEKANAAALKTLRDLSQGIITLGGVSEVSSSSDNAPAFVSPDRVFSRDTLEGY